MEREHLLKNFSKRLSLLMQQAGFSSVRSKAGVKTKVLSEISGCSEQMVRRYLLGEALPDIDVIYKIAKWLKVSPGWLIFGDDGEIPNNLYSKDVISIEKDLLEYIMIKSYPLLLATNDINELVSFIMEIINDATHIDAEKQAIMKIIDISINSATRFSGYLNDKNNKVR